MNCAMCIWNSLLKLLPQTIRKTQCAEDLFIPSYQSANVLC